MICIGGVGGNWWSWGNFGVEGILESGGGGEGVSEKKWGGVWGGRTYVEGLPDVLRGLSLDHGGHGCACQVKEGL